MADLTPTGIFSSAMSNFRDLVAATTQWQTMTGAGDAASAKRHIKYAVDIFRVIAVAVSSNVATLTLANTHAVEVNDYIYVQGLGSPYDGGYTVTAVTANTLSYAKTTADDSQTVLSQAAQVIPSKRPFMIVKNGDSAIRRRVAVGTHATLGGSIKARLEVQVSSGYTNDAENMELEAWDTLSLLVSAITDLSETGTYMVVREIAIEYLGPYGQDMQESNQKLYETWLADLNVSWGVSA
jgi:hypothetical protein